MSITITELKANLGKYLSEANEKDIFITKNGKIIAKISAPYQNKRELVDELFGAIPSTISSENLKEERLSKT
ncbi:MAG: type II toxin-antitoxin system prevent-host-death family antitoxin [Pseudobutyrivibrio sp.]|nr:type II toxin-antitoxin system prevent-host-death family antitoxin [Pseudobutyrivibrio sp.]